MANPFVHMELNTTDLAKAKEFYGRMFGWQFEDRQLSPTLVYSTFSTDSGPGGGLTAMEGAPIGWLNYVYVEDIHSATEQARVLGAEVVRAEIEVPQVGWLTILKDPTGAGIALFQPAVPA